MNDSIKFFTSYYEGHLPILVTSDLEIIKEVFFDQYGNFTARKRPPFIYNDDAPDIILVAATKNRWKRLRTIIKYIFNKKLIQNYFHLISL